MEEMYELEVLHGWHFKDRDGRRKKSYEVLFTGVFTQEHPWGDKPENGIEKIEADPWKQFLLKDHLLTLKNMEIPIQKVSHITHNEQARGICPQRGSQYFTLQPRLKGGKESDEDGPFGKSYEFIGHNRYQKIPEEECVLPGCYSWWGIHLETVAWDRSVEVSTAVRDLEHEKIYVANYLKDPPESRYGNNEFYTNLSDLLMSYGRSRSCSVRDIYLKVGGTLRYLNEIGYVIIICTENDLGILEKYPNVKRQERHFIPNGLVGANGNVLNQHAVPKFKPEYVISYFNCQYFSWEGMIFAFYFPQSSQTLECSCDILQHGCIEHPLPTCVSKVRVTLPTGEIQWRCPNNIY